MKQRLVIAITGSSGAIYGVRLLQFLQSQSEIETHLVVSPGACRTLQEEMGLSESQVIALADVYYPCQDVGAAIASGSFKTMGMVITPCSIRTLSAVACCNNDNLISRAADVTLKERRRLLLLLRETPLHSGHLRLMQQVTDAGGIVMPAAPGFYHHPSSIEELVDHLLLRVLDLMGIEADSLSRRWDGGASS
ncbi:UbiX family flavin prenyltransferase [Dongshaea marina]|uniref:UbiX family flavin prenyltransferase n=1 Tax=Dongshaea marina TaxID=2047966 RepID=UPI000D3E3FE0|nr:UbiX family flavin prenyltransferase [Dongshaea marina]